jgi:hypothetical protein
MRVKIRISEKPFSINAMYYMDKRNKTREAKEWSYSVFHQLSSEQNLAKLEKIRDYFDPAKHHFHVSLRAYYPRHILHRKDGAVSAKSIDVTNWEKPLIDLLFLPKYFNTPSPYGCKNLNVDDKYITSMLSAKIISPEDRHYIDIEIAVKSLDLELCKPSPHPPQEELSQ